MSLDGINITILWGNLRMIFSAHGIRVKLECLQQMLRIRIIFLRGKLSKLYSVDNRVKSPLLLRSPLTNSRQMYGCGNWMKSLESKKCTSSAYCFLVMIFPSPKMSQTALYSGSTWLPTISIKALCITTKYKVSVDIPFKHCDKRRSLSACFCKTFSCYSKAIAGIRIFHSIRGRFNSSWRGKKWPLSSLLVIYIFFALLKIDDRNRANTFDRMRTISYLHLVRNFLNRTNGMLICF